MSVKVHWHWLVFTVSRCEADTCLVFATYVAFVVGSGQSRTKRWIVRYNFNSNLLWGLTCNFIWKLDDFSWFLIEVETERSCWNAKINWGNLSEDQCSRKEQNERFHFSIYALMEGKTFKLRIKISVGDYKFGTWFE